MDAVNDLVQHFGTDASGQAQFGGVFIYSYQVSMWNQIATALGLIS